MPKEVLSVLLVTSRIDCFLNNINLTLLYLIAEQAVISEQDGIFQKIVKQAGWKILEYLISEQAEFHKKKPFLMHYALRKL
jgi:hypothetical protein